MLLEQSIFKRFLTHCLVFVIIFSVSNRETERIPVFTVSSSRRDRRRGRSGRPRRTRGRGAAAGLVPPPRSRSREVQGHRVRILALFSLKDAAEGNPLHRRSRLRDGGQNRDVGRGGRWVDVWTVEQGRVGDAGSGSIDPRGTRYRLRIPP